ncbi:MAG: endonuclease III [Armatimonadetes bacterium]|nr:endonuclease III [Armatimonadota bacterium]
MVKIKRICDLLDRAYGEQVFKLHNPPLEELVLTILSQNTTSKNCRQAFSSLRQRFPSWEQVRTAHKREIARAIYSGGLSEIKAARIKSILQEIYDARGSLDLSWLADVSTEEARQYLLRFHGVGPKTAACVLLFSLGRPVLPVDTHVYRVSKRLGLIGPRVRAEESHEVLQAMAPESRIYSFHLNMVRHGREICTASRPKCGICALGKECDYFARNRAS